MDWITSSLNYIHTVQNHIRSNDPTLPRLVQLARGPQRSSLMERLKFLLAGPRLEESAGQDPAAVLELEAARQKVGLRCG